MARDPLPHFHVIVGSTAYCARGAVGIKLVMNKLYGKLAG